MNEDRSTSPDPGTDPGSTASGGVTVRRLTRTMDDKVVAGVAGGLGRYFGLDPVLFRIGFIALAFAGGSGLLIYLACWLLLPESWGSSYDGPRSARVSNKKLLTYAGAALLVIAGFSIISELLFPGPFDLWFPEVLFGGALIAFGVVLLRGGSDTDPAGPSVPSEHIGSDESATAGASTAGLTTPAGSLRTTETIKPSVAERHRRERSPLGWLGLGAALLVLAGALVLNRQGSTSLDPGDVVGLFLLVIGATVVVGTWFGRARWLIPIGLLVLPIGIAGAAIEVPLRGTVGSYWVEVHEPSDLQEVELLAGELTLDLTEYDFGSNPDLYGEITFVAGRLVVIVPEDAPSSFDVELSAGEIVLFGEREEGWQPSASGGLFSDASNAIALGIRGGFGQVVVTDDPNEAAQLRGEHGWRDR